jgi:hypothetical protein
LTSTPLVVALEADLEGLDLFGGVSPLGVDLLELVDQVRLELLELGLLVLEVGLCGLDLGLASGCAGAARGDPSHGARDLARRRASAEACAEQYP